MHILAPISNLAVVSIYFFSTYLENFSLYDRNKKKNTKPVSAVTIIPITPSPLINQVSPVNNPGSPSGSLPVRTPRKKF
jgi:hypothetical protein